ncbi:MAG: twin-arginine translocation signal domain-containing protein [Eisenbergiella massiliensis]
MRRKGFMKLAAAAAVAAVCFLLPLKADAAELIHSDEYGDVYVVNLKAGTAWYLWKTPAARCWSS